MKTILVPTDFSDNARSAVRYAAALTHSLHITRIILYHSCLYIPSATEIPVPEASAEMLRTKSLEELKRLKEYFLSLVSGDTVIDILADDRPLLMAVNSIIAGENVDLIVAGITGRSNIGQMLIGSNAVSMARETAAPLLIVPRNADFKPIKKAVFAVDPDNVSPSTPLREIKQITVELAAALVVLCVYQKKNLLPGSGSPIQQWINNLWGADAPEHFHVWNEDLAEGIMKFVHEHDAQLIITVPRKYRFLESLFHRSVSKQLAFRTDIPILLLRERR